MRGFVDKRQNNVLRELDCPYGLGVLAPQGAGSRCRGQRTAATVPAQWCGESRFRGQALVSSEARMASAFGLSARDVLVA